MDNKIVSVIIPVFNYGHFIKQTLQSLIAQTYPYWECIVVDDGSTDDTRDVVKSIKDERIRYIYQANNGMSAARNTGIKECTGEFVQFLDADDMLESRKFEFQVNFLVANQDVDMVYCDARYFPSDHPERLYPAIDGGTESKIRQVYGQSKELLPALLVDNIIVICCPLLRKSLVDRLGYFDENLRALEDWEYWLRCVHLPMRVHFEDNIDGRALVRYHPSSASRSRRKMLETNIQLRQRLAANLDDTELCRLNAVGLANATIALASELGREGKIVDAVSLVASTSVLRTVTVFVKNLLAKVRKSCSK